MNKSFLQKAAGFCAYQERTQKEVRDRLEEWGICGDEAEEMIVWLIENNYLNEERFAKAFAGGKFRMNHWGKVRIKQEMRYRGLTENCIKIGLTEISDDDYIATINKIILKKADKTDTENPYLRKHKLARYIIGKGFEQDLVWQLIQNANLD